MVGGVNFFGSVQLAVGFCFQPNWGRFEKTAVGYAHSNGGTRVIAPPVEEVSFAPSGSTPLIGATRMCYPDDLHDRSESIGSINGSHFRHSEDDKDFLHREEASEALLAKITFSPWRGVLGTLGGSTSGLHARVSTCMRQHFGEFRRRKGFLSRTMANFPFFHLIDLS
jgi:hypothetical protein